MKLSSNHGVLLVKLARNAVMNYLITGAKPSIPQDVPAQLTEKRGVFVTIRKIIMDKSGIRRWTLRGCLGYVSPVLPLVEATINAAIAAATRDPRFSPLTSQELSQVIFEVTVLSEPELIQVSDPKDYPKHIKVGLHGIMVEKGFVKSVLLPQIAVEYEWDEKTLLDIACIKVGLPPDAWLLGDLNVYRFTVQVFAEVEPNGGIIERQLYLGG